MKKKQLFINAAAAVLAVGAGLLLTKYLPEGNPYPVLAEDVHDSGSCGTSATWEFDSQTGLLEIAGEGSVSSYSTGRTPWYEYRGYIKKIVVDDSITYLPASIFYDCGVLEELSIPFVGKQREISKSSSSTAYSSDFNLGYIFGTTSYTNSYGYSQPYAKYTGNLGDDNYYHFGPESTMPTSSYSQTSFYFPKSLTKLSITDASIL